MRSQRHVVTGAFGSSGLTCCATDSTEGLQSQSRVAERCRRPDGRPRAAVGRPLYDRGHGWNMRYRFLVGFGGEP